MRTDEFYQKITDQIVSAMDEHGTGWTRGWARIGANRNAISGHVYQGVNVLITAMTAAAKGYEDPRWLTFRQARAAGGGVRKHEKCTHILLMKSTVTTDEATGKEKTLRMARAFAVFNVAQIDGLELKPLETVEMDGAAIDAAAETFAGALGITVKHGGDAAFYQPSNDQVQMPPRQWFLDTKAADATGHYYSVLLHELTHATGHERRLDRLKKTGFGTKTYAFEELVAEIGAVMACTHLGLIHEPRADHAQYLNSWRRKLTDDPRAIFQAAALAQKAVNWMIEKQPAAEKVAA